MVGTSHRIARTAEPRKRLIAEFVESGLEQTRNILEAKHFGLQGNYEFDEAHKLIVAPVDRVSHASNGEPLARRTTNYGIQFLPPEAGCVCQERRDLGHSAPPQVARENRRSRKVVSMRKGVHRVELRRCGQVESGLLHA